MTRRISIRTDDVGKKTEIDLSIHKDLMNIISDFLNSITEISLFLEYSFTDSKAFKKALCAMGEKYSKIYASLLEALYWDKRCQAYGNDADAIEQRIKLTEKMKKKSAI